MSVLCLGLFLTKLTDLESDWRVGSDGRDYAHGTISLRRRVLVGKRRWWRSVDVAVVGLSVQVVRGGAAVASASSFVEAVSETGETGAQRS